MFSHGRLVVGVAPSQGDIVRRAQAWYDLYWEKVRERNMLKAAGARLTKPKLAAAVTLWREDWRAEVVAKQTMTLSEKYYGGDFGAVPERGRQRRVCEIDGRSDRACVCVMNRWYVMV